MCARIGNGTLDGVIERCHACREVCDRYVAKLYAGGEPDRTRLETTRCVALLSMIAERLEADGNPPIELIDSTIELARELPDDDAGCAAACRDAADALGEWLDGGYER